MHLGAYIADIQNSTGAYIIIACLQVLVNNLLVWQSSCKSKLFIYLSMFRLAGT